MCVLGIMMKEQVSPHHWCFVGKGRDRQAALGTAPTRCLRVRGKEHESERAQLPRSLPKSPFLGTALASWQGSEGGPDEGKAEGGASEQEQCEKRGEGKWG